MTWLGGVLTTITTRLLAHASSLLLAGSSAGLAFLLAGALFGPQNAVFAPVAAVVATGLVAGHRVRRAIEISLGVVLGLAVADLLSSWWGIGPLQLTAAVLVAMAAAVVVRPSGLLANQAAVAAVVVITLVPYLDTGPWMRLADALIGGAVAIGMNAIVAPDPFRAARSMTNDLLGRLEAVLGQVAGALTEGEPAQAEEALEEMTGLDGARAEIGDALAATRERLAWRPSERRNRRDTLASVASVSGRVVTMLSTVRGLCRAAANLVRHPEPPLRSRSGLVQATEQLIDAIGELQRWIEGTGRLGQVRELALSASITASAQLPDTQPTAVFVGALRSATIDVLRATGATQDEAVHDLEQAAGRAGDLGI